MNHVQDRIQACLDGELTPTEAEAVRAHCASCPECGRAWHQAEALWDAVDRLPPPLLSRSLWPELQARRAVRSSPWPRLGFATGALAVTAAGLWLGLWFGAGTKDDLADAVSSSLVEQGALLVEGVEVTLDDLYVAAGAETEEVAR